MYDPAVMNPGAYVYTVAGAAPCTNASATVQVNETGSPDAGGNGAATLCNDGAAVNLFTALTGTPDAGGTWSGGLVGGLFDPQVNAAGTYTYTVNATAPCVGAQADVVVAITTAPDAGGNNTLTVCDQGAATDLFTALNGTPDAGGTWSGPSAITGGMYDPAVMNPGAYVYTVAGAAPCTNASATVQVNETGSPDAGADNAVALCSSGTPVNLVGFLSGTPQPGGTWTGPDGGPMAGTLDPATAVSGNYMHTVAGNFPCASDMAVLTLTINPAVDAGADAMVTVCSNEQPLDLFTVLGGTPGQGGSWVLYPNGQPANGTFDPATSFSGTYQYTMQGVAPCPADSAEVLVTLVQAPDAGTDGLAVLCSSDMPVNLITLLGTTADAGGVWLDPLGNTAAPLFDPASSAPGSYLYVLAAVGVCAGDSALVDMGVVPAARAGADGDTLVCANGAPFALFGLLGGVPDAGGTWSAPDGAALDGNIDPANAVPGTYVYTVSAPAPCPQASANVQVGILALPELAPTLSVSEGCAPVVVTFQSGYSGTGTCHWDFGDGTNATACGPFTFTYLQPGSYQVVLTVDQGLGCVASSAIDQPVVVGQSPSASFQVIGPSTGPGSAVISFNNTSTGANTYLWDFGGMGTSTLPHPQFTFPYGLGRTYPVCLVAYASPSCTDTTCIDLLVPAHASVFAANAFTPDGDGRNDGFAPVFNGLDPLAHQLLIVDRWGHLLFSTGDVDASWDGNFPDGSPAPPGVYVWKLVGQEAVTRTHFERTGHVTLLR